jgi:nucleoside-diphosphate-sugar epimerase
LAILGTLTHTVKRLAGRTGVRHHYHDMVSSSKRAFVDCTAAKQTLGWHPNASLERFRAEAIESYFEIQPGDLRLEAQSEGVT